MKNFKTSRLDPARYSGVDIAGIIGAPLIAAAHANSMMAREQIKFLMDFCFTKKGEVYEPVMIRMSMTRAVVNPPEKEGDAHSIRRIAATFELPLLTVIPINSLGLENVQVDFDLEVTSHISRDTESQTQVPGNSTGPPRKEVRLMGKISSQDKDTAKAHYDNSSTSSLKVSLKSGPLPLPLGLTSILDIYTKNLQPVELEDETKKPDTTKR